MTMTPEVTGTLVAPPPVTKLAAERQGRRATTVRRGVARDWPLVTGRILAAAGALLALFVGFEMWTSGLYEAHAQSSLLPAFRTLIATTTLDSPSVTPVEGAPAAILDIPRIGVDQVVVEGTTPSDLKTGPGHVRGSPMPGEFGNAVVAGHRTTYGGTFAQLNRLHSGDTIDVVTGQGYFAYRVRSVRRVPAGSADPVAASRDSRLTLITSDSGILPGGRLAVVATLRGRPSAVAVRAPALVGASELGLSGDPLGLGLGIIWVELLGGVLWLAWRLRRRWPAAVLYLLAAPVVLALLVLTFTSFDLLLPGTT